MVDIKTIRFNTDDIVIKDKMEADTTNVLHGIMEDGKGE